MRGRLFLTLFTWILTSQLILAQDNFTHVFFANQSRLPLTLIPSVTGNSGSVSIRKVSLLPYEITHDHSSTIAPGDIIGIDEKDHNENNSTLSCDRRRSFGANNFIARVEVSTASDLLFTVLVDAKDVNGPAFVRLHYNIEYPDGSLASPSPGVLLLDNNGTKAQVANEINYQNEKYKLVFGTFDEKQDATDNVIFSLSNVTDTIFRYEPLISDTLNPNVLNILSYNPGILMPLNISDQDEDERAVVLYKAMPKNMDFIVFQEFFEPNKVEIILNDLKPWYPYHTGPHNQVLIPGIGKDGGVRIASKYPILEEREISYSENGCVPEDFFSNFANKGVKYAKINKQGQMIHVFGTHTSLQPCDLYIMGQFMSQFDIPKEDVVIMAGDFNVDLNRIKNGSDDYTKMLDTINALEPTYLSFLNDPSYRGTTSGLNHFYCCNPNGRQHLDYVFVSNQHKIPYLLTNRSTQARLNEPDKSFGIFDMGDHEPVYARIEFPVAKPLSESVQGCIGNIVRLEADVEVSVSGSSFQWYKDGQALTGANNVDLSFNLISANDFGSYECRYNYTYLPDTSINNYFDPSYMDYNWIFRGVTDGYLSLKFEVVPENSSESCAGVVTSIASNTIDQWKIFPNPAQQTITISGQNLEAFTLFEIIDITGRVMMNHLQVQLSGTITFDIDKYPTGTYFIRGLHPNGVVTQKFYKMNG